MERERGFQSLLSTDAASMHSSLLARAEVLREFFLFKLFCVNSAVACDRGSGEVTESNTRVRGVEAIRG